MIIYKKYFLYTQKLHKYHHNKAIKYKHYTQDEKIGLNIKYIKNQQNQKPETKFF